MAFPKVVPIRGIKPGGNCQNLRMVSTATNS